MTGAAWPPRVEYSLTERAEALVPVLNQVGDWAQAHLSDRIADRYPAPSA